MLPVSGVSYTTPDGVERSLRFTLGARKRIAEKFGEPNLQRIFVKFGDGALPDIAYALMFDEKGRPPADLDPAELAERLTDDEAVALLAAVMSAASKGKVEKKELEALLVEVRKAEVGRLIGSVSGASPGSASASPAANSGTSPSANSTPSPSDSPSGSEPSTSEPA